MKDILLYICVSLILDPPVVLEPVTHSITNLSTAIINVSLKSWLQENLYLRQNNCNQYWYEVIILSIRRRWACIPGLTDISHLNMNAMTQVTFFA